MHKHLTLLVLFFSHTVAFCQVRFISLHDKPLGVYNRNFHVTEVIDARSNKSNIGWIFNATGKKIVVNFQQPLSEELKTYFQQQFPPTDQSKPVIVKVIKCAISEKTMYAAQIPGAEVVMDFLYQQDSVYYNLFRAVAVEENEGADADSRHSNNLAITFRKCFQQFTSINIGEQVRQSAPLTRQEVEEYFDVKHDILNYPILTTDAPKRGVYQTFLDFRNNEPTVSELSIEIQDNSKRGLRVKEVIPYVLTDYETKVPVKDAWGVSDGENIYIQQNKDYFRLERQGSLFTFYGYAPPDSKDIGKIVKGGVMFGAVGGLVAGSDVYKDRDELYNLDIITGKISLAQTHVIKQNTSATTTKPAKLIIYCRSKAAPESGVKIFLNDRLINVLHAQSFVEVEWTDSQADITICGETNEKSCFTFSPDFNRVNYVECYFSDKNSSSAPELIMMREREGKYHIEKLAAIQDKKNASRK